MEYEQYGTRYADVAGDAARDAAYSGSVGETLVTGTAGNGLVTVRMTALKEMRGVTIKPEAIDASDATLLEDLVIAAVNEKQIRCDFN